MKSPRLQQFDSYGGNFFIMGSQSKSLERKGWTALFPGLSQVAIHEVKWGTYCNGFYVLSKIYLPPAYAGK